MRLKYPEKHSFKKFMEEFIFASDAMKAVMDIIPQVAQYDVNVLIMGESGTGKEMLAKIIHLQSPRAENPFIPVNCGVLSGLMFEDRLFGHEKGAFTGAVDQKTGCFEMADGGTLFLDEISELRLENQVDFLRVLEEFKFTRIGGNEEVHVDVRVISATNKNLKKEIEKGLFREDLFYRLQVVPIHLPPLRERKDIIPKMVHHFLNQFEMNYQKPRPSIHPDVMDIFFRHDWPGNVRELKNLIEQIFIIDNTGKVYLENLPSDFLLHFENSAPVLDLAKVRKDAETHAIIEAFYCSRGDKKQAAELLNISPRTLRHKIQTYDINLRQILINIKKAAF